LKVAVEDLFARDPKVPLLGYVRAGYGDASQVTTGEALLQAMDGKIDLILKRLDEIGAAPQASIKRVILRTREKRPALVRPTRPDF
jgi:hypothetical protein